MKKTAMILILVLTAALFAGCGSDGGVTGTYVLTSIKEGEMKLSGDDLEAFAKAMKVEGPLITLELTAEGKAVTASSFMPDIAGEGTYTMEGDRITITIGEAPLSGIVEGEKITLSDDDLEMVFEKD